MEQVPASRNVNVFWFCLVFDETDNHCEVHFSQFADFIDQSIHRLDK